MRLCFIGNSHIVMVKTAWDGLRRSLRGVDGEFFAASGSRLNGLERRGRSLVSDNPAVVDQMKSTSGGRSSIDVDRYDGFVLVGLNLGLVNVLRIGADHRTVSTVGRAPFGHLVSDGAFDLAIRRQFQNASCVKIAEMIREVAPETPIVAIPTPHATRGVTARSGQFWADAELLSARMDPVWRDELAAFVAACRLSLVEQPEETLDQRYFTDRRYSVGSVRLRGMTERVEEEHRHMNGDYGALVLKAAAPHLGLSA
jgi:hypothetical protein